MECSSEFSQEEVKIKGDVGNFNKKSANRIADVVVAVEDMHPAVVSSARRRRPSHKSGDTYNGYFKLINTSDDDDQKIKIVYGYDIDNAKCGYATINGTVFDIDVDELVITATAYIYLQSVYDTVAETTGTPTIEQSASFPTYEENKFKRFLGNAYYADSKITGKPVQQQFGAINGETVGECT